MKQIYRNPMFLSKELEEMKPDANERTRQSLIRARRDRGIRI